MRTRLAAWLVTGPLGHLAAGVTDWAALARDVLLKRARPAASARRGERSPPA